MWEYEGGLQDTTHNGSKAATVPLTLMVQVKSAASSMSRIMSRGRLSPACLINHCPAQVVIPDASSPLATTNRDAMSTTVRSPNPPNACPTGRMPVK